LNPFADAKFISLLSRINYHEYSRYKLYGKVFETYFPEFLEVPWTFMPYRKRNNLKKDVLSILPSQTENFRHIIKDLQFQDFLKRNKIIRKDMRLIRSRLKELYFLFRWLEVYKERVLKNEEVGVLVEG